MTTQAYPADPIRLLVSAVGQFDRRRKTQQTLTWLPRALAIALGIGVLVALIARTRPSFTNPQIMLIALAAGVAAAVVCMVGVWARRGSLIASAQRFDLDFDLRERVSTALELSSGRIRADEQLAALQIADAGAHAHDAITHLRDRMPLRTDTRDLIVVLVLLVTLAVLLLLPNPQAEALNNGAAVNAAMDQAAETLREAAETVAADTNLTAEQRQALLQDLRRNIQALEDPNVTPQQAFAVLSETAADLQESADAASQEAQAAQQAAAASQVAAQRALEQAAQALRDGGFSVPPTDPNAAQGALEQMQNNLAQIAEQAQTMTPAEQQQAAQALRNSAAALQQSVLQQNEAALSEAQQSQQTAAQTLQQAAEALQQGDAAAAQQQLNQAQQQLSQAEQQAQAAAAQAQQQAQAANTPLSEAAQNARQAASEVSEAASQSESAQQGNAGQQSENNSGQPGEQGSPSEGSPSEGQAQPGDPQEGAQSQGQSGMSAEGAGSQSGEGQPSQDGMPSQSGQPSNQEGAGTGQQDAAGTSAGDAPGGAGSQNSSTTSGDTRVRQGNNPDGEGEAAYEAVNVPRRIGGAFGDTTIQLEADPGDSPLQEGEFSENPEGQVTLPYDQVYGNYRDTADRALESGYVPLALRDVVRDYFTSLEPRP